MTRCRIQPPCLLGAVWLITALVSVLIGAEAALGQNGSIIINQRQELPLFEIEDIHGAVGLEYRQQSDTSDSAGQSSMTDTEEEWSQLFELSTNAFIKHPNFVDLSLFGSFQFEQEDIDSASPGGDLQRNETVQEYDARATILRRSRAPLTLFGTRLQTQLDRQFGPTIENIDTSTGFNWVVSLPSSNHNFGFTHRTISQDDPSNNASNSFDQDEDLVDLSSRFSLGPNNQLDFNYHFDKIDQTAPVRTEISYSRHDGDLTHTIDFGPDQGHNLRSRFEYFDQQGDFPEQRFRWDERLRLHHSDTLESISHLSALDQTRAGVTQRAYAGEMLMRHRLYDSLTTTAQVGGRRDDFSDGFTIDDYFGDLTFDYTKLVPGGQISGDLRLRHDQQDNSERGQPLQILREPHAFLDPSPATLSRANIDTTSIVVHNISNLLAPPVYSEGIDYTVRVLPNRVELRRVVTGRIVNGESVEIDYIISPEPAHETTSDTVGFGLRYDIREGPLAGLALYMRQLIIDESISSDRPTALVANSLDELTLGVEYRFWVVFLEAEHITHDSEISPFKELRFQALAHHRLSGSDSLDLRAQYTETDFTDEDNVAKLLSASGTLNHQFDNRLSGQLELLWYQLSEDISEDSTSFEQRLNLDWRHRQTSVFLQVRNEVFESDSSETTSQSLFAGVRRAF